MTLLVKNFTQKKIEKKYLNKIVDETLRAIKVKKPVEISLVIIGEKRIKFLNQKYRGIDKITDVLSFGNEEIVNKSQKFISPPDGILYLGEIFICYMQAKRQARQKKHSEKHEMAILLIHGILHLLGYDHKENYENSDMKAIEKKVFSSL
ncbi:MAG: rRNA maturation RNase YbeY [Patescibacteria group bacterium]|nr:rRNA maturation RNase YbeY [Patescibacteria group bacterium]